MKFGVDLRVLAGICADLTGDGHIQDYPKLRIDYTSKCREELLRFDTTMNSQFGIRGKIRPCTTNTYGTMNIGYNSRAVAKILISLGVPAGSKVQQSFLTPNWIIKDKILFGIYVNHLFSCEAHVDVGYKAIDMKMHKTEQFMDSGIQYFEEIRTRLFQYFAIRSTRIFLTKPKKRKDGQLSYGIRMKIKRKKSIQLYYRHIGFRLPDKQTKLKQIIASFN